MKHTAYIPAGKKGASLFLLCLPAIAGIALGAFYAADKHELSPWVHQYFCPGMNGATVAEVFVNTLVSGMLFLAAAFLLGASAFGIPFGAALLIYRGFGIGASGAFLYSGGISAVPAVLILLVPEALAGAVLSVIAVRELMRFSGGIFRCTVMQKSRESELPGVKLYCVRFIVLGLFAVIISTAASLLNYLFSGLL